MNFFSGHGEVRVNGGNGANQGFGGAGGRIAVRAGWKYDFPGESLVSIRTNHSVRNVSLFLCNI